jgi:hypothetical protein
MLVRIASTLGLLLVLCVVAVFDQRPAIAQVGKPLALVGGTLIDGTGAPPVRNSVIVIRGDRIERLGTIATAAMRVAPLQRDPKLVIRHGRRYK